MLDLSVALFFYYANVFVLFRDDYTLYYKE